MRPSFFSLRFFSSSSPVRRNASLERSKSGTNENQRVACNSLRVSFPRSRVLAAATRLVTRSGGRGVPLALLAPSHAPQTQCPASAPTPTLALPSTCSPTPTPYPYLYPYSYPCLTLFPYSCSLPLLTPTLALPFTPTPMLPPPHILLFPYLYPCLYPTLYLTLILNLNQPFSLSSFSGHIRLAKFSFCSVFHFLFLLSPLYVSLPPTFLP